MRHLHHHLRRIREVRSRQILFQPRLRTVHDFADWPRSVGNPLAREVAPVSDD